MKLKSMFLTGLIIGIVVLIALKTLGTVNTNQKYSASPSQATAIEQAKQQGQPAWLLFHSTTCESCIAMEKIYEALKPEFAGKVAFINIDVDDSKEKQLLEQYKIMSIPATYFQDAKGKTVWQTVGVIPIAEMRAKLQALAAGK